MLSDSKHSCEDKEIYMRFDFVSRKVVQTNPGNSEHFWNTYLVSHICLAKTSFSFESIDVSR